mgnify:CR=1 FL=1
MLRKRITARHQKVSDDSRGTKREAHRYSWRTTESLTPASGRVTLSEAKKNSRRRTHGSEDDHRFLHSRYRLVLVKRLIELADRNNEEQHVHRFERVKPLRDLSARHRSKRAEPHLLSLRPLSSDVKDTVLDLADHESGLRDTGCPHTRTNDLRANEEGQLHWHGHLAPHSSPQYLRRHR